MPIAKPKMLENYVFGIVFFGLQNDKVSGRKIKLILCIGFEILKNISWNLLINLSDEGIYHSGSRPNNGFREILKGKSTRMKVFPHTTLEIFI